jgi:hypothetical protein
VLGWPSAIIRVPGARLAFGDHPRARVIGWPSAITACPVDGWPSAITHDGARLAIGDHRMPGGRLTCGDHAESFVGNTTSDPGARFEPGQKGITWP